MLAWVRMDVNLPSHDKILELLSDPSPKRWQAAASYAFAICWSGGAGTDGRITPAALGTVLLLGAIGDGTFGIMKRPATGGKGLDGVFERAAAYDNPAITALDAWQAKKGGTQ